MHVVAASLKEGKLYSEVFALSPKLFDTKFPFGPNEQIPEKIDNSSAEYFQLTCFLICERLKKSDSFYEPFLDVLPARNDTMFTLLSEKVGEGMSETMESEIQNEDDDILEKAHYDLSLNMDATERFLEFIDEHFSTLNDWLGIADLTPASFLDLFEWAWMNVATRVFGHLHLPNEIAMCPLMDLINHAVSMNTTRFYLT